MSQRDPNEIVLAASFPKNLVIKNLGDWQTFETKILFHSSCRLLRLRGGVPEGDLATSWSVSPDMREFTFKLRPDAVFSDGTPIDSAVVAFNLKRSFLHGQFSKLYLPILAGSEQLKASSSDISGIKQIDPHSIRIVFTKPVSTFIEDLDMLSFGIFYPSDVDPEFDIIHPNFRASGLYKIIKMAQDSVVMELNERHWNAKQSHLVKRIRMIPSSDKNETARLLDGEVDAARCWEGTTEFREARARNLPKTDVGPVMFFLSIDFSAPALKRYPNLSRDINIALDRAVFASKVNASLNSEYLPLSGVTGNITALVKSEHDRWTAQDRQAAVQRLKTDYPEVRNGHLPIVLAHSGIPRSQIPITVLSEQLKDWGLVVKMEKHELNEMLANKRHGEFLGAFVGHGIDGLTPASSLQFLANSEPSHTNLPPTHELFKFYGKLPLVRTYEEHLALVTEYNDINAKTAFVIPLLASEMVNVFNARFDVSAVAPHDDNWRVDDLRLK